MSVKLASAMGQKKTTRLLEENREAWDVMAPIHARGSGAEFYRMKQFLDGECTLSSWEIEEVGKVKGRHLLHLQCHIGTDTLSWARRGAEVTGLDFSEASIAEAKRLAKATGQAAEFVNGDVYEAAKTLSHRKFDLLYTGRGALCWLPDLERWAEQCALLTKPGGILFLEEHHPTLNLFDVEKTAEGPRFVPCYDAFSRDPVSESSSGSYADRKAETGVLTTHCWEYSLGHLLGALTRAGFDLIHLHERDKIFFEPWKNVFQSCGPYQWEFREGQIRFPLSFTLKMKRR